MRHAAGSDIPAPPASTAASVHAPDQQDAHVETPGHRPKGRETGDRELPLGLWKDERDGNTFHALIAALKIRPRTDRHKPRPVTVG